MKLIHKIKAAFLLRALVRQRAHNIASIRAGRREAKILSVKLAREKRLSGISNQASANATRQALPFSRGNRVTTAERPLNGQISAVLAKLPQFERAL